MHRTLKEPADALPTLADISADEIFLELDRANVGMSLIDIATRRFLRANAKLCAITGYTREELLQKTAAELTHPDDKTADQESFTRFVHGDVDRRVIEKRYVRKDGGAVWVHITTSMVRLAGSTYLFGITEDITTRKHAQQALGSALVEAERARQALQKADRRKDEFLAMLAHELRNPLSSIHNAIQVLGSVPQDAAIRDRMQAIIARQSVHLARLVDDLLDVTRIRTGKITLRRQSVRLADVVAGAVEATRPLMESRGHRLAVDVSPEPVWLIGDEVRLVQVLANLLSNAAKYTSSDGRIAVTAAAQGSRAVIRVEDSGVGIPAEVMPHIFDLFEQADSTLARTEGGLGIGLTIVKNLVEGHGGSIRVSSAAGRGTTAEVRLPRAPDAHDDAPAKAPEQAAPRRNILVVEDNPDAAESLSLLLRLHGHQVRTAGDGPAALDMTGEFHPDVLLIDIGLPGMDGYELARRLRRKTTLQGATFIAISGYSEARDKLRSAQAGYDYNLVKPVSIAAVEETIARHSGR
ncbi:MAG TPA: ATP-binding protein [Burkholderiales bacterium]|nr:ATP-binding protein [Burkholderiales bacterium]